MAEDRPGPGEELNRGAEAVPRPASTVMLVRGGADALEVLLVKRTPRARFMGGAWVFPGGAVDTADAGPSGDGDCDDAHRAAAVRELREEAGVTLTGPEALVKFSRWITPAEVKVRFDTHFFLAELPAGQQARVDSQECVDLGWFTPSGALQASRAGEILLVFPTIKHLEQLAAFSNAAELLSHSRGRAVVPVQPRVLVTGETARVVLPGEQGYEDSPAAPPEPA